MYSHAFIGTICCLYLGFLFLAAYWVERKAVRGRNLVDHPLVYSLSLMVYLTAWTFYGSVGKAVSTGTLFLTFYIGPSIALLAAHNLLRRSIRIRNMYRITSIADFISLRYDRSASIAFMVTIMSLFGIVPYIALQLKAIITTFEIIAHDPGRSDPVCSNLYIGLIISVLIILFTIVMGVRREVPTERHQGMVIAIVIESVFKLMGLVAVGVFVTYILFDGFQDIFSRFSRSPFADALDRIQTTPKFYLDWLTYLVLSMSAFLFLPRQFHMSVVENFSEIHIRKAGWIASLYFILITIFILPIALGGSLLDLPRPDADVFVLLIPIAFDQPWLSLLVFIAGFSASIGMIMISAMTISTMVTNHIVMPVLDWARPLRFLKHHVLKFRWLAVTALISGGYWLWLRVGPFFSLVDFGVIAFAAVLQFTPSILGAFYWRRGHWIGALSGLIAGFVIWFHTLIVPVFVQGGILSLSVIHSGPWGISALKPEALFGLAGLDPITHSVFWTLFFNAGLYVAGSLAFRQSPEEKRLADSFVDIMITGHRIETVRQGCDIDPDSKKQKIVSLFTQYFPLEKSIEYTAECFDRTGVGSGGKLSISELAELQGEVERRLGSVIGAATAHSVIQRSDIISPDELDALKSVYSDLLAQYKLTPSELVKQVNVHEEREQLLTRQAKLLEEKILERDHEIQERKRIEEELRLSRSRLASIIDFHPDPTFTIDLEGRITSWNRAAEEFTGVEASEVIGKGNREYAVPFYGERRPILIDLVFQSFDSVEKLYPTIVRTHGMVHGESFLHHPIRGDCYLIGTAAPLLDPEGNVIGAIESIRDISERKRSENALFESRQMLQLVLDNVPQRIFWKDRNSVYLGSNKALAQDCGYSSPEDLVGKTDFETAAAEHAERYRMDDRAVMESGIAKLNYEEAQTRPDGSKAWLRTSKIPLRDAQDQIIAVLGMYEDISEQRRADEEIRRLNRVYAVLSEMNQMIVRVREAEQLVDGVCRIAVELGQFRAAVVARSADITGSNMDVIGFQARFEQDRKALDRAIHNGLDAFINERTPAILSRKTDVIVFASNTSNNSVFNLLCSELGYRSSAGLLLASSEGIWGALHLFSDEDHIFDAPELQLLEEVAADFAFALESLKNEDQRRQAEEALYHSEERYRSLVENLDEVIFMLDEKGFLTYVSPAIERLTQYGPAEVIGSHFSQFLHPDDLDLLKDSFFRTLNGEIEALEYRILDKKGIVRWIRSSSRQRFSGTRLVGLMGILTDITDRKLAEDAVQQRLIEMEAMHKVSAALRSAGSIDEILSVFLDETIAAIQGEAGCMVLIDPETKAIQHRSVRGWCGLMRDDAPDARDAIFDYVLDTGAVFASAEYRADSRLNVVEMIPPDWGGACVPIRSADRVVGAMMISVRIPRILSRSDERLLNTLAEIAGNSIHRISLNENRELHLRRLNAMHTIDRAITGSLDLGITLGIVLDQVMAHLDADAADIVSLNMDSRTLTCLANRGFKTMPFPYAVDRIGEGFVSQIVMSRKPIDIPFGLDHLGHSNLPRELVSEGFVAYHGVPLMAKGQVKGVLEVFHRKPFSPRQDWIEFLQVLAGQAAVAIDNTSLLEALQTSNQELIVAYDATLEGWARALELHDQETEGHSRRVIDWTLKLARAMHLDERDMIHIRRGALLHDIGKMGIPDQILKKPGKLTPEEWEIMCRHPQYAFEMLYPILYLRPALDIPYGHHEKWNGTGYPRGLSGEKIPIAARLFAIVDVYDALLSDRSYRPAWPQVKVLDYIRSESGIHFDPRIVDTFLSFCV